MSLIVVIGPTFKKSSENMVASILCMKSAILVVIGMPVSNKHVIICSWLTVIQRPWNDPFCNILFEIATKAIRSKRSWNVAVSRAWVGDMVTSVLVVVGVTVLGVLVVFVAGSVVFVAGSVVELPLVDVPLPLLGSVVVLTGCWFGSTQRSFSRL